MPRLGLGLGLNLPTPTFFINNQPVFPKNYVLRVNTYSPDYFSLVTGDSINVWEDITPVTYGAEAISNGDFSNGDTGWANQNNVDITDKLTFINSGAASSATATQTQTIPSGVKYRVSFTVSDFVASGGVRFRVGGTVIDRPVFGVTGNGDYTLDKIAQEDLLAVEGCRVEGMAGNTFLGAIDNISVKQVLTGTNDLDQGISANQPTLIEQDVLTQYTASNQPTYDYDKILTQDNVSNQPTLVDVGGGVRALEFNTGKFLSGYPSPANNPSATIEITVQEDSQGVQRFIHQQGLNDFIRSKNSSDEYEIRALASTPVSDTLTATGINKSQKNILKFVFTGTQAELHVNGSLADSVPFTGVPDINEISRSTNESILGKIFLIRQWNSDDSSGDPDFVLDVSNASNFRTSANEVALLGQKVAKAYAEQYNPLSNVSRFDSSNDFMLGIPHQAGDFALQFKKKANTLGTVKTIFSSSTTSAEVRINTSNQIEVVSDAGTLFTYTTSNVLNAQQTNILQLNGNNLELYEIQVPTESKDVTGETFTLDRVSADSIASDSDWKEIAKWFEILDQKDLDYFYYLRDENNEYLLSEDGEMLLPEVP